MHRFKRGKRLRTWMFKNKIICRISGIQSLITPRQICKIHCYAKRSGCARSQTSALRRLDMITFTCHDHIPKSATDFCRLVVQLNLYGLLSVTNSKQMHARKKAALNNFSGMSLFGTWMWRVLDFGKFRRDRSIHRIFRNARRNCGNLLIKLLETLGFINGFMYFSATLHLFHDSFPVVPAPPWPHVISSLAEGSREILQGIWKGEKEAP